MGSLFLYFSLGAMDMEVRWELEVERRDCEAVDDTFGFYSPRVSLFSSLCFRVRDRLSIWVCSAYQVLSLRTAAEQLASLFCYLLLLYVYYILQNWETSNIGNLAFYVSSC